MADGDEETSGKLQKYSTSISEPEHDVKAFVAFFPHLTVIFTFAHSILLNNLRSLMGDLHLLESDLQTDHEHQIV